MKGISHTALKWLACLLMLIDHVGMLFFPQIMLFRLIGRLAFPIFAFQIAEGYRHTKHFNRYALRLFGIALLSEIPFDLAVMGECFSLSHQNVMFTLLFGLLGCKLLALLQTEYSAGRMLLSLFGIAAMLFAVEWLQTDYGAAGILTVLLFFLTARAKHPMPARIIGMTAIHGILLQGASVTVFGISLPVQGFAILALIPIAFYRGEKGYSSRILQYGCYLFYPLHLLMLFFLR